MSEEGQTEKNSVRAHVFRFALNSDMLDAVGMSQTCDERTTVMRSLQWVPSTR